MTVTKVSVCWSVRGWEGLLGLAFTAVGCSAESGAVVCCSAGQVECVCVCVYAGESYACWICCAVQTSMCVCPAGSPCMFNMQVTVPQ